MAGHAAQGAGAAGGGQQEQEDSSRNVLLALVAAVIAPFMALILIVVMFSSMIMSNPFDSGGEGEYPQQSGIPTVFWDMYNAAAKEFGVNPYLLASIHKQETGFGSNPAAAGGANGSGARGPMQFLQSTWDIVFKGKKHGDAFRAIEKKRPAKYPLQRAKLPSCAGVGRGSGCPYDSFDSIAAAASYLKSNKADKNLNSSGTRKAVCRYIGSCSEVKKCTGSINQYCQVLPRAQRWELAGAPVAGKGAEGAVQWALKQEGIKEQPVGSNCGGPITDWQRRAGGGCGGAWLWCGTFVHEAYLRGGVNLPDFVKSVPQTLDQARAGHKQLKAVPAGQIQRGDLVIFDWGGDGTPDHVGLATDGWAGGKLKTIEGNTSNGVYRRTHPRGPVVAGVRVTGGGTAKV